MKVRRDRRRPGQLTSAFLRLVDGTGPHQCFVVEDRAPERRSDRQADSHSDRRRYRVPDLTRGRILAANEQPVVGEGLGTGARPQRRGMTEPWSCTLGLLLCRRAVGDVADVDALCSALNRKNALCGFSGASVSSGGSAAIADDYRRSVATSASIAIGF
jgi:hypothetical protein